MPKDRPFKATCSKCSHPIVVEPQEQSKAGSSETESPPVGVDVALAEVTEAPTAIAVDLDITSAYDSPLEVSYVGQIARHGGSP